MKYVLIEKKIEKDDEDNEVTKVTLKHPPTNLPRVWRRIDKVYNLPSFPAELQKKLGWYPVTEQEIEVSMFEVKKIDTVSLNQEDVVEITYKTELRTTVDEIKGCLLRKIDNLYQEKSTNTVYYDNNEFGIKQADKLNIAGTATGILTGLVAQQPIPDFPWTNHQNIPYMFNAQSFMDFSTKIKSYLFTLNGARLMKKHAVMQEQQAENLIALDKTLGQDWPSNNLTGE